MKFIFLILFMIMPSIYAAVWIRMLWIGLASRDWPTVQGQVISMEVSVTRYARGSTIYRPILTYRYQVHNQNYESTKINAMQRLIWGSHFKAEADSMLDGYAVDDVITVYYNPNKPAYSLLKPGASIFLRIITCLTVILTLVWLFAPLLR